MCHRWHGYKNNELPCEKRDVDGAVPYGDDMLRKDKGMRYPMINKQPRREVNVPELSGGLNLRDSLTGVRDNQMTDCVNMWYKDGALRTRPPFVTNEGMLIERETINDEMYDSTYIADIQSHPNVKNGDAVLISGIECDGRCKDGAWQGLVSFFWQYPDKTVSAGHAGDNVWREIEEKCTTKEELEAAAKKITRLIFEKDGHIYLFLSEKGKNFSVYKSTIADELSWDYINWYEYYVPTVYAHCLPTNNGWGFTGTQFEAYNSLCDSYKMVYSLYNPADSSHEMRYKLAGINLNDGHLIEAIIIDSNGKEHKHMVELSGFYEVEYEKESTDGKYMVYIQDDDWQGIVFTSTPEGDYQNDVIKLTEADNCAEDNLIITISPSHPYNDKNRAKIFNMTQSAWFGGAADGIYGGSRLFLCGNKDENEKALVVWSSLNNPLYFPENNYAYVGEKSQGVTAFGQQGENLIIFKEKSTYYSYYATNDNITADDLINQSVIDYEANAVSFPMIQLNASIGCDCPNTVELCRNRLVWANSDGSVYTLYSNNQYSERTIYKVSDMVYAALSKENDLKNAVSCDFEGHYLLSVGNKIYVMDYNSYGYQYASSFSKNEDSNAQIPWYIWTCDCGDNGKFYEINNRLMIASSFTTDTGVTIIFSMLSPGESSGCDKIAIYDNDNDEIVLADKKIASSLQTKLFDFGAAGYLKNIDRVTVGFGNNGGQPISLNFVSDVGNETETVSLRSNDVDERDAAFVSVKSFGPLARAVRTFGVKIECDGQLCIQGLSLQYRLLGGVK